VVAFQELRFMAGISLKLLVLKTRQVDKLRAFYLALGIEFGEERHGDGPVHYAGRAGGCVLEIYPLPDDVSTADTTARLGFAVADLAGVVQALQALGAAVTPPQETPWGWRAVMRDPDGRAVELSQQPR
jgi:predicted enzyme related to lactoylglutathione lyase